MTRTGWVVALALLLTPTISHAIQLHWSTGADTMTVAAATQCMLVVQADSVEATLPSGWRLLWVADTTEVAFVALDSAEVCAGDTAQVYAVAGPSSSEDSSAHLVTAHFCSGGSGAAVRAAYRVELPGDTHGKFKVVALDPADSTQVLESNEVTCNGGIEGDYAPVAMRATSVHQSLQLRVTVLGSNLATTTSLNVAAPDGSWEVPLVITATTGSAISGVASIAALLPACQAKVVSGRGVASRASLAADPEVQPDIPESGTCSSQYYEELLTPPPAPLGYTIQPKDFSFTPGFVDSLTNRYAMHFFYIRHNYWYYQPPDSPFKWRPDLDEKNLGHTWSSNFTAWQADPADTAAAHWSSPIWLRGVSQDHPAQLQYWHATEHLGSGDHEWLAAFNDNESSIEIMGMFPPDNPAVDSLLLDCPNKPPSAAVGDSIRAPGQLRLVVLHPRLGAAELGLRLELPWRTFVRLAVYDVAGRRLSRLVDGDLPAGVVNVKWNGTDESGAHVASGVYFVRLTCAKGIRLAKVVMLR